MDSGTRRNFAAYYANFITIAAVGFLVNPLLLGALGPIMFGVWKSLQRFLDFATVADGRASQALKWIVASRTQLPDEDRQRDIGAAIIVWLRWLPAAVLVAAAVTFTMPILIKGIPEEAKAIAYTTAAILTANTLLAGLLAIPDSVLVGVNQGYRSMMVSTATVVASNGAMIGVAVVGWPLWSMAVVVLIAAVASASINLMIAERAVPWWGIARPTTSDLRRVFGYSAWTLGWVAVDKLFLACELIIISVSIGVVAVTQYSFTTYVMQFVISIALVTASGFMPLLGSQLSASAMNVAADRARSVRQLTFGVAVLGGSAVLAFNGAFVALWVGSTQYLGTDVNALLVVCGLQLALIRLDGQILDVTMRIAPKVLVGLLSSAGGILAGCLIFLITERLTVALMAVIGFRAVSNVAFPWLVARSIPGSALTWRPVFLAVALLLISFGIGPLVQSGEPRVAVGLVAGWVLLACTAAWCGLIPRATVRALFSRRGS